MIQSFRNMESGMALVGGWAEVRRTERNTEVGDRLSVYRDRRVIAKSALFLGTTLEYVYTPCSTVVVNFSDSP